MEVLHKLRKQPAAVRSQIAFWSSGAVAVLVGLVWFSTLGPRLQSEEAPATIATIQKEESSSFNEFFSDVGTQIGSVIDSFKEEPAPSPGATTTPTASPDPEKESRTIQIVATSTPDGDDENRTILIKPRTKNTTE